MVLGGHALHVSGVIHGGEGAEQTEPAQPNDLKDFHCYSNETW
jgi:hypothetical protein